jgi:hypothetical protein
MKDIECPYCGHEQDICNDDGHGYSEDEYHQEQCENCEKNFVFTTYISFDYTPQKADCLNDGKHDFKKTTTVPDVFSKMRCTMCAETRDMTEEERLGFGIKTIDEYFKSLDQRT